MKVGDEVRVITAGEAGPANRLFYSEKLARPERFELPTPRSVVWCSIQLSYGRLSAAWRREGWRS
jgi:hypothetical protein